MAWSTSQAGQGALGGAATGAAIGSVIPGLGTVVGAGIGGLAGGLLGGFGGDDKYTPDPNASRLETGGFQRQTARDVLSRAMGGRDVTGLAALRGQLQQVASGQQAGAGELAARRMGARTIGQLSAQPMGARGFGAAGMAANAQRQIADVGTQTAGMATESALQDQAAARNALLGAMETELRARGLDDQQIAQALDQLARVDMAEMQARLSQEGYTAQQAMQPGVGSGLLQMGGNTLMALPSLMGQQQRVS